MLRLVWPSGPWHITCFLRLILGAPFLFWQRGLALVRFLVVQFRLSQAISLLFAYNCNIPYDTADSARIDTTEHQVELECKAASLGHISISGVPDNQLGDDGNRLHFAFAIDQSHLPSIIAQFGAFGITLKPCLPVGQRGFYA